MVIIGNFKVSKGYEAWKKAFLANEKMRKDYEIMMAVNRHTITPLGWFHEQDNYKKVSQTADILCREVGLNNYERTDLVDFSEDWMESI